MPFLNKITSTN